jgi:hypothetical protein
MMVPPATPLSALNSGGQSPSWLKPEELHAWQEDLDRRISRVLANPEQNRGFLEEHIRQATLEIQRTALERALQAKADTVGAQCPKGHGPLQDQRRLERSLDSWFGRVKFSRFYGYCARCQQWHFPADGVLGLGSKASASPGVQELAALLVSKMPAAQAEPVAQRLTGLALSRSTLDREARRQGKKAQQRQAAQLQSLDDWEGIQKEAAAQNQAPQRQPFTLVIEIDAWNIRERDDWGHTQAKRQKGEDLSRWHWVYVAFGFRRHRIDLPAVSMSIQAHGTILDSSGGRGPVDLGNLLAK